MFLLQLGNFKLQIGAIQTPHEGASAGRRNKAWVVPAVSGTQSVIADGETLRNRTRHLVRNNPWANNAVDVWAANCVGTGIHPRSTVQDRDMRERLHDLWEEWQSDADADAVVDFYGLQVLVMRGIVESGEIFPRLVRLKSSTPGVPLRVQLIEPDQVPLHLTQMLPRSKIVAGIELSQAGKRLRYHMYKSHPGDPLSLDSHSMIQVPAEEICHVYVPERAGQLRGTTWFGSILQKLRDLDQYDDAELIRKKTAALFAGFITRNADGEGPPPLAGDQGEIVTTGDSGEEEARLEPGTMQVLEEGEDVKFSSPADLGGQYDSFYKNQLRAVAAGINGMTYEQLTGDLSGVNFSSIRAGIIEFRRRCQMIRKMTLNHQFNRRVWSEFVIQAALAGRVPLRSDEEIKQAIRSVKWIGQAFEYVQPLQDQMANQEAVRSGFKSRSAVAAELGSDPEELEREIQADNKRADERGLVFDTDARRVEKKGAGQKDGTVLDQVLKQEMGAE